MVTWSRGSRSARLERLVDCGDSPTCLDELRMQQLRLENLGLDALDVQQLGRLGFSRCFLLSFL